MAFAWLDEGAAGMSDTMVGWEQNETADWNHVASFGAAFCTDKIEPLRYFPAYVQIAADLGPRASVCEIGVWQGESLRMWQALFPLGKVTGVDYTDDHRVWPLGTAQVICHQEDPHLPDLLADAGVLPLNLIVDDGCHRAAETRATFGMLWPLLAPGGYYVIEDWWFALDRPADHPMPGVPWERDDDLLAVVIDLIRMLDSRDSECDSVQYRWGLAIAHKRAA